MIIFITKSNLFSKLIYIFIEYISIFTMSDVMKGQRERVMKVNTKRQCVII